MNNMTLYAVICGTSLLVGCGQNGTQPATADKADENSDRSAMLPAKKTLSTEPMDSNVLLTVNGQAITKEMLGLYSQDRMHNRPKSENSPETQVRILNELSNVLIVAQDAEKKQFDKRAEIEATLTLLKAKLLAQMAIQEFANSNQPTDEEIQTIYDSKYAGTKVREFKASHILVKEEEQAKNLIAELSDGADFAELAKQHSTGPTGKNGGDLGWFEAAQMVKPFSQAVMDLEPGSTTNTPVKTQFGWHVIKLVETRDGPPPALEAVRNKIVNGIQQESLADYMQELRGSSQLVFNNNAGFAAESSEEAGNTPDADNSSK